MKTQSNCLDVLSRATPDNQHEWLLPTVLVAQGFGVTTDNIRQHKSRRGDELLEHTHWLKDGQSTAWTKRGVVRLGMFIESEQAKQFRDAAESYLINAIEPSVTISHADRDNQMDSLLQPHADRLALALVQQRLPDLVEKSVDRMFSNPTPDDVVALNRLLQQYGAPMTVDLLRNPLQLGGCA